MKQIFFIIMSTLVLCEYVLASKETVCGEASGSEFSAALALLDLSRDTKPEHWYGDFSYHVSPERQDSLRIRVHTQDEK